MAPGTKLNLSTFMNCELIKKGQVAGFGGRRSVFGGFNKSNNKKQIES